MGGVNDAPATKSEQGLWVGVCMELEWVGVCLGPAARTPVPPVLAP